MLKPQVVVRFSELRKFIPIGHTVRDELIEQGLLKVVPLTPKGRAKAITLESVVRYQREVMGLDPLDDDGPEVAPRIVERGHADRNT
jgi:hypothetical protein